MFSGRARRRFHQNVAGPCGRWLINLTRRFRDQAAFAGRVLILSWQGTPGRWRLFVGLTLGEIYKAGFGSINLVFLVGFMVGYLWSVLWFGSLSNLGGIDSLSVLLLKVQTLEVSPILTAIVLILRYGAPMTLEVAVMKSDRQFRMLASQGIPPEHYLGLPRLAGVFLAFPPLLALFNIASLLGAYWGAWQYTGRPMWDFVYELSVNSTPDHFAKMFFKSSFASLSIAFSCLYNAFRMPLDGLHIAASSRIMRAATGESFFYAVLTSVLVTVFYD